MGRGTFFIQIKDTKRHLLLKVFRRRTHFRSSRAAISHSTLWYSLAILQCSLYTRTLSFRVTQGGTGFWRKIRKTVREAPDMCRERQIKNITEFLNSCSSQLPSCLYNFSCLEGHSANVYTYAVLRSFASTPAIAVQDLGKSDLGPLHPSFFHLSHLLKGKK